MNYEDITKIAAERIDSYMTEAINAESRDVAEMFNNAAWGVRTLWFEHASKIEVDAIKKNKYTNYELREKFDKQHEKFMQMTDRERVPLLISPE